MHDACKKYQTFIWTYALMDNHVHHVAVPDGEHSLHKTIKVAHGDYTCGLRDDLLLFGDCPLVAQIPNWSEWLRLDSNEARYEIIRRHTESGRSPRFERVLGSDWRKNWAKSVAQKARSSSEARTGWS
jgi:hypothetical protein